MPSPRILIVDDDPAVRAFLAEVVRRDGCEPVLAASGVEGYAALTASAARIALVLLDLSMPEMDGFRFRELQLEDAQLAGIPVIVLTGFMLTPEELSFMRPAVVLSKPASVTTIRDAIRRVISVPATG